MIILAVPTFGFFTLLYFGLVGKTKTYTSSIEKFIFICNQSYLSLGLGLLIFSDFLSSPLAQTL